MPLNGKDRPNARTWVCTCLALSAQLCEYVVQAVSPISPVLFPEVEHSRLGPGFRYRCSRQVDIVDVGVRWIEGTHNTI
ncbi:hypothetical protein BV22DRAFT_1039386 [Leucogyrophana mollusca]|uniref:Uncharacterized protein n=1 Tax=Leucogyrophana mollusca TaxID=85980 RepID=A0ACB8B5Y0_9AGAM|nr:hypothetical protein BV22DRAFT_1039386 [Leucogyrophana mollusca]